VRSPVRGQPLWVLVADLLERVVHHLSAQQLLHHVVHHLRWRVTDGESPMARHPSTVSV
jgi:hypothetical protein